MYFSVIVPVYNRPDDLSDLLPGLVEQSFKDFEVIIVESGSTEPSDDVIALYSDKVSIQHLMAGNDGQGFSRNFGMKHAKGDFFVILDSDLFLDPAYLQNVKNGIERDNLDCFGGPDKAHPSFTPTQKAIDFAMTSVLTTGGIRGGKTQVGKFFPRSFNMGFSRKVYEATNGFKFPFFGEDIELSRRIMSLGFNVGLIPEAYVYHKRKTSLKGAFKQMEFFGRARIQIFKLFPDTLKVTHFFPAIFMYYSFSTLLSIILNAYWGGLYSLPLFIYLSLIFISSTSKYKSPKIGLLTIGAVFYQMYGYGIGFTTDFIKRLILGQNPYTKNKDNDDR